MTEVQTPMPAPAANGVAQLSSVDKDALVVRLDALLEQYLHTLDEYEKLMGQLSKQLSSGYFSLTQANFHNRSGVHYGQDSYDERVQATRKIVVTEDEEARLLFSTASTSLRPNEETPDHSGAAEEANKAETPSTPGADSNAPPDAPETEPSAAAEDKGSAPKSTVADPIRMFGILVPPALRSAQTSFREAVEGPVVKLASVAGELRAIEREIGRVRKGIRKA